MAASQLRFDQYPIGEPDPYMKQVYGYKLDPSYENYAAAYTAPYRESRVTGTFQPGVYGVPFTSLPTFSNVPLDNGMTGNPGRSGQGTRGLPLTSRTYYEDYTPASVHMPRAPYGPMHAMVVPVSRTTQRTPGSFTVPATNAIPKGENVEYPSVRRLEKKKAKFVPYKKFTHSHKAS